MMSNLEPYEEYYYSNVCHVCKIKSRDLIDCEQCFAYRYCSPEHRKIHRPKHALLCRTLSRLPVVTRTRSMLKYYIENAVCRPLTPSESHLWMFPRVCAVCFSSDRSRLRDCPNCPSTSYCSNECQNADLNHESTCKRIKVQSDHYYHMMNGIPADFMVIDINLSVKKLRSDIFKVNELSPSATSVFLSEKLSHAFTLYHAMQIFDLINNDRLVIHIVGAMHEYNQFDRQICEFLFHWMPSLKSLHVVLVGPELCVYQGDEWEFCSSCTARRATVSYRFEISLYTKYYSSASYKRPNIVAVFNCGFHEFQYTDDDPWTETLPLLLSPNVPLLFTSYTIEEARKDMQRLQPILDIKVVRTIACQPNACRSLLPLRDWTTPADFYYKNNFYTVIQVFE